MRAVVPRKSTDRRPNDLIHRGRQIYIFFSMFSVLVAATAHALGQDGPAPQQETLSIKGMIDQPSTNTSRVEVYMRGARAEVPRNFLIDAYLHFDKVFLMLGMTLPAFAGASADNLKCFHPKYWRQCPYIIYVFVPTNDAPPIDRSDGLRLVEKERHLPNHEMLYGLARSKTAGRNTFIYIADDKKQDQIISCFADDDDLAPCRVQDEIDGLFNFNFEFHKSQLEQWQNITANVRLVVNAFFAGAVSKLR